jgi:hypothetical protein
LFYCSTGFSVVNEITKFTLDRAETDHKANGNVGIDASPRVIDDDDDPVGQVVTNPAELTHDNSHVHYDIRKARHWMEKQCQRKGVSRYALKRLHNNLSDLERARGMVDLAVEAKFLSVVWHPNISKLWKYRGLENCVRNGSTYRGRSGVLSVHRRETS